MELKLPFNALRVHAIVLLIVKSTALQKTAKLNSNWKGKSVSKLVLHVSTKISTKIIFSVK